MSVSSTKESSKMYIFSTLLLPVTTDISFSESSHAQGSNSLQYLKVTVNVCDTKFGFCPLKVELLNECR